MTTSGALAKGVPGVTVAASSDVVAVGRALFEEDVMRLLVRIGWTGVRSFGTSVFAAIVLGILCAGLGTIAALVGFVAS
jgi:hypothetical protein